MLFLASTDGTGDISTVEPLALDKMEGNHDGTAMVSGKKKKARKKRTYSVAKKASRRTKAFQKVSVIATLLKKEHLLIVLSFEVSFLNPNAFRSIMFRSHRFHSSFIFFSMAKHKEIRESLGRGDKRLKVSIEDLCLCFRAETIFAIRL